MRPLSIPERLAKNRFNLDEQECHIEVNQEIASRPEPMKLRDDAAQLGSAFAAPPSHPSMLVVTTEQTGCGAPTRKNIVAAPGQEIDGEQVTQRGLSGRKPVDEAAVVVAVGALQSSSRLGRGRHVGHRSRPAAGPGPGGRGSGPGPSAAVLDAQSIKSSEGGEARGFDMGKKTTGRKRHLVVDTLGLLLVVMVTSAAVQDRRDGRAILELLVWRTGAAAQRPETQPPHRRLTQIGEMRPSG